MAAEIRHIVTYRPWQLWTGVTVVLVVVCLAGWWLYDLGRHHGVRDLADLEAADLAARARIDTLEQEKQGLIERMAVLERSSQVDRQASIEVRQSLGELQEALAQAREELAFYQGIMAPGEVEPGLRIQRLEWEPGAEPGSFRYDLMLTQVKRNDRVARGVVHLQITGDEGGKPTTLALAKVTEPAVDKLHFRFRYFQHFEGEIRLPASFRPKTVVITLEPKGSYGPKGLEKTFDWPV